MHSNHVSWLFSEPSLPSSLLEGLSMLVPSPKGLQCLDLSTLIQINEGFHVLDLDFLTSFLFPDIGLGPLSSQGHMLHSEGFIAPNILPTNLNGWDGDCGGASGVAAPLTHPIPLSNVYVSKHRRKNKCVVVSQEDSNLILGEDLSMAEVVEMEDKIVVGKAYGQTF
jgi:hypothetical protein